MAVEPHTVMVTETGRPREYQAKAGDSGVFSGRTAAPPPYTWVGCYHAEGQPTAQRCTFGKGGFPSALRPQYTPPTWIGIY